MKFISKSEQQTINFAKKIAKTLKGSDVLALVGDLGSGKTVFVKGLAKALGVKECAHSPTFVLMHLHKINGQGLKVKDKRLKFLCHIDAYRLENADALLDIGADEYIGNPEVITAIEWADKIYPTIRRGLRSAPASGSSALKILPKNTQWIYFKHHPKKEGWRIIETKF